MSHDQIIKFLHTQNVSEFINYISQSKIYDIYDVNVSLHFIDKFLKLITQNLGETSFNAMLKKLTDIDNKNTGFYTIYIKILCKTDRKKALDVYHEVDNLKLKHQTYTNLLRVCDGIDIQYIFDNIVMYYIPTVEDILISNFNMDILQKYHATVREQDLTHIQKTYDITRFDPVNGLTPKGHVLHTTVNRKSILLDSVPHVDNLRNLRNFLVYAKPKFIIDAGNVGFFLSHGEFNINQVNKLYETLSVIGSTVVILSTIRYKEYIRKKYNWLVYTTPIGVNDDIYWMYASIYCNAHVITNDLMRDHQYISGYNVMLSIWQEQFVVGYSYVNGKFTLNNVKNYSRSIQKHKNTWYIPIKNSGWCYLNDG